MWYSGPSRKVSKDKAQFWSKETQGLVSGDRPDTEWGERQFMYHAKEYWENTKDSFEKSHFLKHIWGNTLKERFVHR